MIGELRKETRAKRYKAGKHMLNIRTVMDYFMIKEIDSKLEKIEKYIDLVKENRKWANLISRKAQEEMQSIVLTSMSVFSVVECGSMSVVEIGSGSGVLGIIAAILCPEWKITLTERTARKSAFMAEAVGSLSIDNVDVYHGDAEGLKNERQYDLCMSRASGLLDELVPLALGLLKNEGKYIAIKGTEIQDEVMEAGNSIKANGGKLEEVRVPEVARGVMLDGVSLVVIKKEKEAVG